MPEFLKIVENLPESHIMTKIILINVISKYCLMFFFKIKVFSEMDKYC